MNQDQMSSWTVLVVKLGSLDELILELVNTNVGLHELFLEECELLLTKTPDSFRRRFSSFLNKQINQLPYERVEQLIKSLRMIINSSYPQAYEEFKTIGFEALPSISELFAQGLSVAKLNKLVTDARSSGDFKECLISYHKGLIEEQPVINESIEEHCELCDCSYLRVINGWMTCQDCGLIMYRVLANQERRIYNREQLEARRQTESVWREFGPRTKIKRSDIKKIGSVAKRQTYSRLSKIQRSLVNSLERNFWQAIYKLELFSNLLPEEVLDTAWKIYKKAVKKGLINGRSIEQLIGASLYTGIRVCGVPMLLFDLLNEFEERIPNIKSSVTQGISLLIQEKIVDPSDFKRLPFSEYVKTYCYRIGIIPKHVEGIISLTNNVTDDEGFIKQGLDPAGIIGAAIYMYFKDGMVPSVSHVSNYNLGKQIGREYSGALTQSVLAEYMSITDETLRARTKTLKNHILIKEASNYYESLGVLPEITELAYKLLDGLIYNNYFFKLRDLRAICKAALSISSSDLMIDSDPEVEKKIKTIRRDAVIKYARKAYDDLSLPSIIKSEALEVVRALDNKGFFYGFVDIPGIACAALYYTIRQSSLDVLYELKPSLSMLPELYSSIRQQFKTDRFFEMQFIAHNVKELYNPVPMHFINECRRFLEQ